MLNRISSGWIWLETAFNAIIDEVNRQKPLGSASIAVEESPNGMLLKVAGPQQTSAGGGEVWDPSVSWQLLTVIDTSSGSCVNKYIWYWGTAAAGSPGSPPAMPHSST